MPSLEAFDEPEEPPEPEELANEDDESEDSGDDIVVDGSSDDGEFAEFDPSGRYGRYAEVLGKGAMKTVYRGYDMTDCKEVAWNRARPPVECSDEQAVAVQREVHILQGLHHEGILKLYSAWLDESSGDINFITELCSTTLLEFRLKHRHISRKAVKNWGRQILRGLAHLHTQDPPIIHRDLKCENILVKCRSNTALKIGDFGSATFLDETHHMHTLVGTPEFMAPEMFQEDYNELVDVYSFGMCILELLTRECPYSECKTLGQIYKKVMKGEKPKALQKVTDMQALSFINRCLLPASTRPSAIELLADPFLKCHGECKSLITSMKPSTSMPNLRVPINKIGMKSMLSGHTARWNAANPGVNVAADIESKGRVLQKPLCAKSLSFRRSYRVTGRIEDDNTLRLKIRIQGSSRSCDIDFPFDLRFDSPRSVAEEMVRTLDYSESDLITITDLIREEIIALLPGMKGRSNMQSLDMNYEDSADYDLPAATILSNSRDHLVPKDEVRSDGSSDTHMCHDGNEGAGYKTCRKALDVNNQIACSASSENGGTRAYSFNREVDYNINRSNRSRANIDENDGLGTPMFVQGNSVTESGYTSSSSSPMHTEAGRGSTEIDMSRFFDRSCVSLSSSSNGCITSHNGGDGALAGATAVKKQNVGADQCCVSLSSSSNGCKTSHNDGDGALAGAMAVKQNVGADQCCNFRIKNRLVLFGSRQSSPLDSSSRFKQLPTGIGILLRPPTEQGLRQVLSCENAST